MDMQACLGRGLPGHALDPGRRSAIAGVLGIVSFVSRDSFDIQLEEFLELWSGVGSGNPFCEIEW